MAFLHDDFAVSSQHGGDRHTQQSIDCASYIIYQGGLMPNIIMGGRISSLFIHGAPTKYKRRRRKWKYTISSPLLPLPPPPPPNEIQCLNSDQKMLFWSKGSSFHSSVTNQRVNRQQSILTYMYCTRCTSRIVCQQECWSMMHLHATIGRSVVRSVSRSVGRSVGLPQIYFYNDNHDGTDNRCMYDSRKYDWRQRHSFVHGNV